MFNRKPSDPIVHYATGSSTVCGVHISGGTFGYGGTIGYNRNPPVQHTCILDDVTCRNCRNSIRFKTEQRKETTLKG